MGRPGSNLWSGIKRTWDKVAEGIEVLAHEKLRWRWNKTGTFTVKSAYQVLSNATQVPDPIWGRVWKLRVPERCKMLMWLAIHGRLLTNVARCNRGLTSDASCPLCGEDVENVQHIHRDCSGTLDLWKQIVPQQMWIKFCDLNFDHWVRWNINPKGVNKKTDEWRHTFAVVCWWLWRRRNKAVFEGKRTPNHVVLSSVFASMSSMKEARTLLLKDHGSCTVVELNGEKWQIPPEGWIKINTDGAFSHLSPGIASGGILRDEYGNFLRAFAFKGMEGDILAAELWGCLHGLKLAWDMRFHKVVLEADSADAIEGIIMPLNEVHEDSSLFAEIKSMISRDWNVEVRQISRWANSAADLLAKSGLSSMPGLHVIFHADTTLEGVLVKDKL